jgi:N-carbamoyl-L-amino-acid hydrolase
MAHLIDLAEFGKNSQGGVSRVAYSEADIQARQYAMELMRAAQLDVSIDAAGNIVGRRSGTSPSLPPLVMGSHIDSVPQGGKYDGAVGSLGAIEVAQTLAEHELTLVHPLEVIIFQNEEHGSNGSRALSLGLTENDLEVVGHSGMTRRAGIRLIGGNPAALASVKRERGDVAAFLELHIEQGGILDSNGVDIGVVEGIVGNNRWEVTIDGIANHAGTTPMDQRHDALLAAAKFIDAVNRIVTGVPGRQVATVGRIEALPGAPNVIAGKVILTLEMRDLDRPKIEALFEAIHDEATERIAAATKTEFHFRLYHDKKPALTDERIRQIITRAAAELDLSAERTPSSAGHDSQNMALLGPMGMIFIPSVGGISHSADEFSRRDDIINGVNVLLHSLIILDKEDLN